MSTLGIYDLAGNVREWCFNEAGEGQRATRGAAWPEASFHVGWVIPKPVFDRHPTNGIRLIRNTEGEERLAVLREPVERTVTRDFRVEEPVSDRDFEVFRRMYAYDPVPLNPQVERADTFEHWVREIVRFDVPYGERGGVVLFLPKDAPPPFQPILVWGGSGLLNERSSADVSPSTVAFLVRDGRALAVPIFKGAYERDDSLFSFNWGSMPGGREGPTWRDYMINWQKDLSGTVDYLQTREDMDAERVGYLGHSFGGMAGPVAMAVEPRIKAGVLRVGGLFDARFMPEADPFNYVPRVRTPTLMLNGEHDIVFSCETQQLPMFQRLGTRPEDKRHVVTPSAHTVPQDVFIRETLAWFDKYLGVPGGG
jgi:pimeloyl-ACP methyl ester carboxylesterase